MKRVHLVMTLVWALCMVPTLLWWRESILWVAFMSLYANIVGHWGAWQATKAEESANADVRETGAVREPELSEEEWESLRSFAVLLQAVRSGERPAVAALASERDAQ